LSLLEGVSTYYMDVPHSQMTDYPQAFAALVELLNTGQTDKLSQEAPTWQGIVHPYEPIREEEPILFPDQAALTAAAVGERATRSEAEVGTPLRVSVAHGSLRYASYPVAVGHYFGDTIVSAEAYLDVCLNGRLTERFRMDLYPGPVGTVEVIRAPECSPPGGLIIGLGEVGAISAEKIRRGITEAALRHALMVAEEGRRTPTGTWQSAAFSTLLLGTQGGGALSIGSAVTVIVQAIIEANRTLRSQGLWDQVRIDAVEFVELYEDIAIEAAHASARLEERLHLDLEENESIAVVPYLRVLKGGRYQQPANPYATGWWRRIQIAQAPTTGSGETETADLQFLVLTDRARAEQSLRFTQRALIDQFIDAAIQSPGYNPDVASTLFELLIPSSMKELARDETDLVLVLDQAAAQYPWELLAERTRKGPQPLAKRTKVVRQFKTSTYRASPQPPRGRQALVIGDPVSELVELPGAQAEAETVADILKNESFQVTPIIRGNALSIISALFAGEYRVVHLAGHGIYDPANPRQSGMVLGGNIFLTAAELSQLRVVPDVVFINCCHLGRIDAKATLSLNSPHKLAASIAQELINLGVKAVIAAGWAVDDAAALSFARTFYTALLHDGQSFGSAVFQARQEVLALHHDTNTWGAYQCYGNPDFLLADTQGDDGSAGAVARYFARREYFDRLRMIVADAVDAGPEYRASLLTDVEVLNHALPTQWRDGEMTAALARAWAVLERYDDALSAYQQAILEPNTQAPIDAIEQFVQLMSRHALHLRAELKGDSADKPELQASLKIARQSFSEAAEWLTWLLRLGESPDRLCLLGELAQELARLSTGQARTDQLEQAADYYHRAYERSNFQYAPAALAWASLQYLLSGSQEDLAEQKEELSGLVDECEKVVDQQLRREATLRSRLDAVYVKLLRRLVDGNLPKEAGVIADDYQTLLVKPSPEAAAVERQLLFLIDILAAKRRTTLVRALETIKVVVEPYAR
jgi:CHAT domain-containing protein